MIEIKKIQNIFKSINIPGSKSYANRALILASLRDDPCQIKNLPYARDTLNLIKCLSQIGIKVKDHEWVYGVFPNCEVHSYESVKLCTGDGGTTNRFLVPFLALGKNEYHLYPDGRMIDRPMDDFKKYFSGFRKTQHYFKIKGNQKEKRKFEIDCSQTTQVASSFLLSGHNIQINDMSSPYIQMTIDTMKNFQRTYLIEPDWSSAAFPIVLASLGGQVTLNNIKQQDSFKQIV